MFRNNYNNARRRIHSAPSTHWKGEAAIQYLLQKVLESVGRGKPFSQGVTRSVRVSPSESYQRGIALYVAIVVTTVLLGIGIGISSTLIRQAISFRDVGDSVLALYAADGGIERVLEIDTCMLEDLETDRYDCIRAAIGDPGFTDADCEGEPITDESGCRTAAVAGIPAAVTLPNGASYEIVLRPGGPPCPGGNYCAESKGTYLQSTRKIEISR